jgi:hypothetical protein
MPWRWFVRCAKLECAIRGFGKCELGSFQQAVQFHHRCVVAHGGDLDPGPVCIGDPLDGAVARHQQRVVELKNRRREVADVCGPMLFVQTAAVYSLATVHGDLCLAGPA